MPEKKPSPRMTSRKCKVDAVEHMRTGENVRALARELGVLRKSLSEQKDRFGQDGADGLRPRSRPCRSPKPSAALGSWSGGAAVKRWS